MSNYQKFIVCIYPFALMVVSLYWWIEHPRFTWKEMYLNMWEAE